MKRGLLLAMLLALGGQQAWAAFPGNGFWDVKSSARRQDTEDTHPRRSRRVSRPLDIYPPYNPHIDNALYGRGLTESGGSAYQTNEYRGRGANMSYSYYDGGFNPGGLYSFSAYPHFDRPGFTYWQGGN
ncbi:MAG TPA: hypothetical protein VFI31_20080 [Pirellulales bacterium]|nr:hypothetical protein [Pirellulales bacterium]